MRALYSAEDLDSQYLMPSARYPDIAALVQGKYQVVLGDHLDIIFLTNVLALVTNVARLGFTDATVPILSRHTRWLREDVSVARGDRQNRTYLWLVRQVSNAAGKLLDRVPNPLHLPRTTSTGASGPGASSTCATTLR